ncbi:MAG: FtsW/RodA/SpoVE family cell cycle protein [Planctomycetota bacterium]|jgi:cell division protein FtsW (lipid II flippase)
MYNIFKGRLTGIRMLMMIAALGLILLGIATIYAVGNPAEPSEITSAGAIASIWKKQVVFAIFSCLAFAVVNMVHYRLLGSLSYWIYAMILVLLFVLLFSRYVVGLPFAPPRQGVHRWIVLHPSLPRIQPSELCKLAYILALAWYLRYRSNYSSFRALIGPFSLTLLPMILILPEPDLGTVLLLMPTLFIMLSIAGAKVKHLVIIIMLAVLVSPILWTKMNNYQRIRISSVLLQNEWIQQKATEHPKLGQILVGKNFTKKEWESDWGYHLIRSKYAVASGGFSGQGYGKGPFIKYNFLPERHNDFIFSIIAHQWGFIGSLMLIFLYGIVLFCGLEIAARNPDPFGRLLATGIVVMFSLEIVVNICMTLGLMPITGLTLPLVSYGGSSLLVSMTAIGLLHNVGRRRPFSVAKKSFE